MSRRTSTHRSRGGRNGSSVGYGQPPAQHRFKPGETGNPNGRPHGSKNEATIIRDILFRKVEIQERGKTRKITVFEAMLLKVAQDGLKGDTKAVGFLLNRQRLLQSGGVDPNDFQIDDKKVIDDFLQKFTAESKKDETS